MLKLLVAILILAFGNLAIAQSEKPTDSSEKLTEDQLAVYQTFLASYSNGSEGVINLADTTEPLELSLDGKRPKCLHGIDLANFAATQKTVHLISGEVTVGTKFKFVQTKQQSAEIETNDPQHLVRQAIEGKHVDDEEMKAAVEKAFSSGLLTLSEIAFDKSHEFAVMSFSFFCGSLCGNGEALVFHKVKSKWEQTKRSCGGWVS